MIKAILKKTGMNEVKESGWLVSASYVIYKGKLIPLQGRCGPESG